MKRIFVISLIVAGCATQQPHVESYGDRAALDVTTATKRIQVGKVARIEGPPIISRVKVKDDGVTPATFDARVVRIRSAVAAGMPTLHQLYVEIEYTQKDWRYYTMATVNGQRRPVEVIERQVLQCGLVGGCEFREVVGVSASDSDMKVENDLELTLFSKSGGTDVLVIPLNYIDGFLAAVGS